MKKRLCLLLLPLALFSCSPDEEKPADLISEEKMTRIMIDVHLTEAVIGRAYPNYDSSRVAYKQAHKLILKRHAVSDSAFKHSYDFYLSKPEQMDKIYEVVLDSLSAREAKLTAASLGTAGDTTKAQAVIPDTSKTVETKFRRITVPDSLKALQKRGKRMIEE